MYDVIVVGMGPAGAVSATHLCAAGFSVLGLEWKAHPRYKVCGGGLSARIDPLLDTAYRETIEETIHTVRFQSSEPKPFEVTSVDPIAYMVMRDRFDAALVVKARANGATVHENERVVAVSQEPDGVTVKTARGSYRGRILVGADGANSVVRRMLLPTDPRTFMIGIEGEVQIEERPPSLKAQSILLDIGVLKGGYAWVFPKKGHLSIGAAEFQAPDMSPKTGYERFLREEPSLAGLMDPVKRGCPIPIYREPTGCVAVGHVALVGDAAELVDPLFGEGIYYAVLSARLAADSIIEHLSGRTQDLTGYAQRIARQIYPEFRVAARIAWFLYGFPHVFHRIAHRRPAIMQLFYDVLKGRETYQSFYFKAKEEAVGSVLSLLAAW